MAEQEKIRMLEEVMELDEGTLHMEDVLEDFMEWDSIAALAFIALMDEQFHKTVSGSEIKMLKTVADAVALMV